MKYIIETVLIILFALGNLVVWSLLPKAEDKNGNLWFSSDGEGVWRYDGKFFKKFNTQQFML